jgi:flagellin
MRRQITGLKVYQKNAKDGIGMIQTAEGALTEVHSMLNRMYELNEQATNSLYETVDKEALQSEYNELVKEINRIGTSAEFNGTKLLNGNSNNKTLHIDENTANDLKLELTFDVGSNSGLSVVNASNLKIGKSDATISDASGGVGKMGDKIKDAINGVSALRAKLGAYQNRLEHTVANLSVMHENMTNAESSIRDTDVADEMMMYTKNNIMIQASQAMLAQANQQPQGVLQLLQ